MSYGVCHDLYPTTPCPAVYEGETLIGWTATAPYPETCTYNSRQVFGVVMGMLSIMAWIMVSLPQLWVNYKLKRAESLSIFFLLQWFSGDITNLIGCYLTKQTTGQKFLALYYVFQDCCLFSQYIYYQQLNKSKQAEAGCLEYQGDLGREHYVPSRRNTEGEPGKRGPDGLPVAAGGYVGLEGDERQRGYGFREEDIDDDGFEEASMKTRPYGDSMMVPSEGRLLCTPVRQSYDDHNESGRSLNLSSAASSARGPSLGDLRRDKEAGGSYGGESLLDRSPSAGAASRGSPPPSPRAAGASGGSYMRSSTYKVVAKKRLSTDAAGQPGSMASSTGGSDFGGALGRVDTPVDEGSDQQPPRRNGSLIVKSAVLLFGVAAFAVSGSVFSEVTLGGAAGGGAHIPIAANAKMGAVRHLLQLGGNAEDLGNTSSPEDGSGGGGSSTEEELYYIGTVIGWISACLYLGSRIPQLILNCRRGTTDGLSPMMFTMAAIGNTTYFLGMILLTPSWEGILCHLPWIIGSIGTVQFDCFALAQFLYYRKASNEQMPADERTSLFRGPSPLPGSRAGSKHAGTTGFLDDAESEVHSVPMVLPATVYAGAIRRGYYGRIGIWYND